MRKAFSHQRLGPLEAQDADLDAKQTRPVYKHLTFAHRIWPGFDIAKVLQTMQFSKPI
jgi:hypothetical protein